MLLRFTIGIAYWTVLVLALVSFGTDPQVTLYRKKQEIKEVVITEMSEMTEKFLLATNILIFFWPV